MTTAMIGGPVYRIKPLEWHTENESNWITACVRVASAGGYSIGKHSTGYTLYYLCGGTGVDFATIASAKAAAQADYEARILECLEVVE